MIDWFGIKRRKAKKEELGILMTMGEDKEEEEGKGDK